MAISDLLQTCGTKIRLAKTCLNFNSSLLIFVCLRKQVLMVIILACRANRCPLHNLAALDSFNWYWRVDRIPDVMITRPHVVSNNTTDTISLPSHTFKFANVKLKLLFCMVGLRIHLV